MKKHETEAYGPRGDASRHRPLAELEAGLRELPPPPADGGRVVLVTFRRADGVRETPTRVYVSAQEGVPGDRWSRRLPADPDSMVTMMRRDVGELVANGQALTVFGDNLIVDLDISEANAPAGTRLRVGQALLEVTPEPHNGCRKFAGRFGTDALRFVQAAATRAQNLRGIHLRVVQAGDVAVGDVIQVLFRPIETGP